MTPALLAAISDPTSDDIVKIIAVSGSLFIAVVAIVFGTITGAVKNAQRERSRRDIAAFVAEGSMTADEGERLLKAGATKSAWHEKS
jgi:hypothetical protein